jgi:hypothetical protein
MHGEQRPEYLRGKHVCCQICLLLDYLKCELGTLANLVANNLLHLEQLPFLQLSDHFRIRMRSCSCDDLQLFTSLIFY